ncbi:hypothetical protein AAHC03_019432 [Spirometra sp. Aus1]
MIAVQASDSSTAMSPAGYPVGIRRGPTGTAGGRPTSTHVTDDHQRVEFFTINSVRPPQAVTLWKADAIAEKVHAHSADPKPPGSVRPE